MGFAGAKAASLTMGITKLSTDIAAFYNKDPADVANNLQMAMMGYTRSLRDYNIVVNESDLKAEALKMGLTNGTGALTDQTKALAAYQLIVDKTSMMQGYAVQSTQTWAGEVRRWV